MKLGKCIICLLCLPAELAAVTASSDGQHAWPRSGGQSLQPIRSGQLQHHQLFQTAASIAQGQMLIYGSIPLHLSTIRDSASVHG